MPSKSLGTCRAEPAERLPSRQGCWREFDEQIPAAAAEAEFPQDVTSRTDHVSRREFLEVMSASLAIATAAGCNARPREGIVARATAEEVADPGSSLYFASVFSLAGVAEGILVEQQEGLPVKIEGNPDHPASRGATDAFAQAAILGLYDSDRSRDVFHDGEPRSWAQALKAISDRRSKHLATNGRGLVILTGAVSSPTLSHEVQQLLGELPEARWYQYEALGRESVHLGTRLAFGRELDPIYRFDKADVILSLDADFLGTFPGHLRYARDFAERRRVHNQPSPQAAMSRLYAVTSSPGVTSAVADHCLAIRASDIQSVAKEVQRRILQGSGGDFEEASAERPARVLDPSWLNPLVDDLMGHRGRSVILAGPSQPPSVHLLTHSLNHALGNLGQTVSFIRPIQAAASHGLDALRDLVDAMRRGEIESLFVLAANPVFDAPADLRFAEAISHVPFVLHLGLYRDETARHCPWHVPETHFLETWGDALAYDGTAAISQPVTAPLENARSLRQMVEALRGGAERTDYDAVRDYWRQQWNADNSEFERRWETAVHDGWIHGSEFPPEEVEFDDTVDATETPAAGTETNRDGDDSLEIVFRADPTIYDGRFANNPWLQELPKPLTSVTWDNVAAFGRETAARLGLAPTVGERGGDVLTELVRLRYRGRVIEAPAWVMPGHAEGSITVFLGYGRTAAGRVASGRGYNASRLRTAKHPWFDMGVRVERTGRTFELAATQLHHRMAGREIVRAGSLAQYLRDPRLIVGHQKHSVGGKVHLPVLQPAADAAGGSSLYPEFPYTGYRWGMVIDLTTCIGCNACVVACQAENNIPSVGKNEVLRGREMHWLRVDTYYHGETGNPRATYFQPVPCMHCENAPCETVCPVNATVHSDEGLNDMNYARCVGTRYCSNNCPYKVRRFNYFSYAELAAEVHSSMPINPHVTVRSRGVMEKCTYCVQRINEARIHAQKDDRPSIRNRAGQWVKPILSGELLTACQSVCPAQAIVFGDLNDPAAEIGKMRYEQPLNYGLLNEELGTQPRTTYLAALRNPNPSNHDD